MKKVQIVCPEVLGHIAPEIYGHFTEHIGGVFYDGLWVGKDSDIPNIRGFRKDLVEKLRKIKPAVLRWPGGCYAETYHWRDGIGKNRPVRPNWWTPKDGRYETNEVGTHEFVDLCEMVGAKPYFAVNVTSITPMEARDWMDYCLSPRGATTLALEREANGHPEPFDIPYWGIGNENWGDGGHMTPDYYALEYRRFSTVLKNICGDRAKLIIGGANGADYNWTHKIAENLVNSRAPMDGMSFHYYCKCKGAQTADVTGFGTDAWYTLLENAARIQTLIERHSAITVGYGMEEKTRLVIDEWGCWHPDGSGPSNGYNLFEQQSTMRDAMVTAISLNIFNNHCDKLMMTNVAQLCNNLHCLFLAGGEHCITTPTYHVYDMFKGHQGGEALRVLIADNADLHESISASVSQKEGKLTVTLANTSCEKDAELQLECLGLAGTLQNATVTLLSADDCHAHNTFEEPEKVTPKTLPFDPMQAFVLPKASIACITADIV